MHSHQDPAHGQQEHAACLRSHRTKYEYRNIKNKWVNRMVSDDHQGSTTQEKSSALKKMTCSLLVSVFDWQLLGYGKNHKTEEMTVILFDWSSIFSAKKSVRAFVSFHKFSWFSWPPSSLVEKNWAGSRFKQLRRGCRAKRSPDLEAQNKMRASLQKWLKNKNTFVLIILYCFNSHWKPYF